MACFGYTSRVHKCSLSAEKNFEIQWFRDRTPNPATPTNFLKFAITAGPDMGNETPTKSQRMMCWNARPRNYFRV
jgi:hypothetical protein